MATSRDSGIGSQITAQAIESAMAQAGLRPLPSGGSEKLLQYLDLLVRWNSRLNLTAIREPAEIVRRHLVECVQCAQVLPPAEILLDFGSGAGLPGIPIAIVRPEIRVTLGESQRKKAAFLREAVRVLSLNADVYEGRIESMPAQRTFGIVTLRAVDKMVEACRIGAKRLAPGGWLVIFTTRPNQLQFELQDLSWKEQLATPGLEDGLLMLGQGKGVPRGTLG